MLTNHSSVMKNLTKLLSPSYFVRRPRQFKSIRGKTITIALVISLFISASCRKKCISMHYNFAIDTTNIYPEFDSIAIGDTLFFSSKTSTQLTNLLDGKKIDYSKSPNFGSIIGFTELVGLSQTNASVDDFSIFPIKGKIYTDNNVPSPETVKQVIFAEEGGEYLLSFGIIPKKKGIYTIGTADLPDVVKDCNRSIITMKITNIDPHLHYISDIYYGGGPIDPLDATHSYCFKVY